MADKTTLSRNILAVRQAAKALAEIGAPVPKELTAALEFSTLRVDTEEMTVNATAALQRAKNETEVKEALAGMAAAHAAHAAQETLSVALLSVQSNRLIDAVNKDLMGIYGYFAEKFNELAPQFEKAAADLPDLTAQGTPQWNYTQAQSDALRETKRLKAEMDKVWLPYKKFANAQGCFTETIHEVYALGEPETNQQAMNVNFVLNADKFDPVRKALLPVHPYIAFVLNGVKLNLSPDPRDVQQERIHLMRTTGGNNPAVGISDNAMIR
jgi:hypothetical protein